MKYVIALVLSAVIVYVAGLMNLLHVDLLLYAVAGVIALATAGFSASAGKVHWFTVLGLLAVGTAFLWMGQPWGAYFVAIAVGMLAGTVGVLFAGTSRRPAHV